MTAALRVRPASAPPAGLPGLDPRFSRLLPLPEDAPDTGLGVGEPAWHHLDTGPELAARGITPVGTVLAVHGNPTWSYLWRSLIPATLDAAAAGRPAWRVVAVDQLDMGFSARTGRHRTLPERVRDLDAFTTALGLTGPVVVLGHDWGGVVAMGWAVDHPDLLAGLALLNTAIAHPDGEPIPAPLRAATAGPVLRLATSTTPAFLETTLALAHPPLAREVADAYRAPYRHAEDRGGVEGFVADIPGHRDHPSAPELRRIAAGVARLDVPALLQWGPRDPVFRDRYLDDLVDRLPQARVHRYEGAGHLVAEDVDWATPLLDWLTEAVPGDGTGAAAAAPARATPADDAPDAADPWTPLWDRLDARADDQGPAVLDMGADGGPRTVSWRLLARQVRRIAAGLRRVGVEPGDRVSLLVQPGPTLTALVYACLRIGAVVVVADAGLGPRGLTRAQRGAQPDWVVGQTKGLLAARALGWPGVRIAADPLGPAARRALDVAHLLVDVADLGRDEVLPAEPGPADEAAILFTSGSTGPAKGVVYTHAQLSALRDVLATHFDVGPETGLVTGFAPFALLGPALGTRSVTPDMDVSAPRTLTARAVADAVRAADGSIVFLSPAAILNVVATADDLDADDRAALARVRTFLSTGAPISADLLGSAAALMPAAEAHTPYGMTECLLVTDITLGGIRSAAAAPDAGVCVGRPVGPGRVLVSALDADGAATGAPSDAPGVLGEVLISAPHLKQHYDRLWLTDRAAERDVPDGRWHRTGDVGHLDAVGRLWIEGRLAHVLVTADGPLAPVGPEQHVERVAGVRRAAVVGVGPAGVQQAVAVVEPPADEAPRRAGLAPSDLADAARAASPVPLAAVLVAPRMPTDVRHNSKIDRTRLAAWAARVLSGGPAGTP
ncbi:alpha/beta fold hydrolase [Cellulomonas sp. GbtcB1]|uniref:alpha/beta fold hydrolase n=1 Tax=Cellulomonas sp. GbtcB1 TaxID=2824746 RepID=UPI001C3054A5|nr:alpha/beta fold hydrolase [Cellulomonas sp. GbtcB1]